MKNDASGFGVSASWQRGQEEPAPSPLLFLSCLLGGGTKGSAELAALQGAPRPEPIKGIVETYCIEMVPRRRLRMKENGCFDQLPAGGPD